MKNKHKNFLIMAFVGIIAFGAYYYNSNLKSEASDGSLSSSLDKIVTAVSSQAGSDKAMEDTAFILQLASITKIKIDTSLLLNQSFKNLVDNNVKLEPIPYGRTNPFSPIGKDTVSRPVVSLKTASATLIYPRSGVLNGSLEGANSNNVYFEYGTTDKFGKVTPKVNLSLIGSFSSTITFLNPKTTYFFRSAANINGVVVFGETMSFTTN